MITYWRLFRIKIWLLLIQNTRPRAPWTLSSQCSFFNYSLVAPQPTLGHYRGVSHTHPMLITAFYRFQLEGHGEPCDIVGFASPVECLVGFEPGTFRCEYFSKCDYRNITQKLISCERWPEFLNILLPWQNLSKPELIHKKHGRSYDL